MTIIWFNDQAALDAAFPIIKKVQGEIAEKFEGRAEIQKGITSPDLSFGD